VVDLPNPISELIVIVQLHESSKTFSEDLAWPIYHLSLDTDHTNTLPFQSFLCDPRLVLGQFYRNAVAPTVPAQVALSVVGGDFYRRH
jgi:hypothetical protein